jgi:hypothetical protein
MGSEDLNPLENPEIWDYISINGIISPGLCELSGFKRDFGWDIKKGKGAKGSTLTLVTFPPCEGTVVFKLWTKEHFDAWAEFRKPMTYDPTKHPVSALTIGHPSFSDIELTSVIVKSMSPPMNKGGGLYEITVEFIEYNPPPNKSAVSSPAGTNAKTKPGEAPILTEQEKQLADLLKQFP